jgi:hypothetical protein
MITKSILKFGQIPIIDEIAIEFNISRMSDLDCPVVTREIIIPTLECTSAIRFASLKLFRYYFPGRRILSSGDWTQYYESLI